MTSVSTDSTKALADSNILLYAFDTAEPAKRLIADNLLKTLLREHRLVLSVQNLNEFYNIATRPNRPAAMTHEEAITILENLAAACDILSVTQEVSFRAYYAIGRYKMSLWDALIWAVAKQNDIAIIYTEDAQSAPVIEGVQYINPFAIPDES